MFNLFQDNNKALGAAAGTNNNQQIGVNNIDGNAHPEDALKFPVLVDPISSWIAYRCWIECHLDAGIALHKPLPQSAQPIDTLASAFIDDADLDKNIKDVNYISKGSYTDIEQRMATSTYTFKLRGCALRVGNRIPVPALKSIAGVPAIPAEVQKIKGPLVLSNFSGIPVYYTEWELWYYVTVPPQKAQTPPPNLAEHIRGDAKSPVGGIAVPQSPPDWNAVTAATVLPQPQPPVPIPGGGITQVQ